MLLLLDEFGQNVRRTVGFGPVEYVFENSEGPSLISGYAYKGEIPTDLSREPIEGKKNGKIQKEIW